ncbi:MAG: hypothetical protein M0019_05795 [Actinomycetota bacterium]|nr:hypothetical protein [Actinomycetota bacterium]
MYSFGKVPRFKKKGGGSLLSVAPLGQFEDLDSRLLAGVVVSSMRELLLQMSITAIVLSKVYPAHGLPCALGSLIRVRMTSPLRC